MNFRSTLLAAPLLLVLLTTCSVVADESDDALVDSVARASSDNSYQKWDNMPLDKLTSMAESGDPVAQNFLAFRYATGKGVDSSLTQAAYWFRKSADQGDAGSQVMMCQMFLNGFGVSKSFDSAAWYADQAAQQHYGSGELMKARFVMTSAKSSQDSAACYMWVELAGLCKAQGGEEAKQKLMSLLSPQVQSAGDSLARVFLADKLHHSTDADTMRFIRHLAALGDAEGEYRLGMNMFFPNASDSIKGVGTKLIRSAADKGNVRAEAELGEIYYFGNGAVNEQDDSAAFWYAKAAALGDALSQLRLGMMYQAGAGVKKNPKESLRLFKLSAAQNYPQGINALGNLYWSNDSPKKNKVRCRALLAAAESYGETVDIITMGALLGKMNDKEKAECEELEKALKDPAKIRATIEGFTED
jgi:TPR repeat protein